MQFSDLDCRIGFCKELEECRILLDTEEDIPVTNCERCLLEWLRQPTAQPTISSEEDKQHSGLVEED